MLLTALLVVVRPAVAQDAGLAARIAEVPLAALPFQVPYRDRLVTVMTPEDADLRARGGSGGPLLAFEVGDIDGLHAVRFVAQAWAVAVLEGDGPLPVFELWSNAGGGVQVRCEYRWQQEVARYCCLRADDYEAHDDEALAADRARPPGETRILRRTRTRPLGCDA